MVESNVKSEYQEFNEIFRNRLIELVKDRLTKREIEKFGEFTISGIAIGSKHNDLFANRGAKYFKRRMLGICGNYREMLRDDFVALLREFGFRYAEIDRSLELIKTCPKRNEPMMVYIWKYTTKKTTGIEARLGGAGDFEEVPVKRYIRFRANKTSDGQDSYRVILFEEE